MKSVLARVAYGNSRYSRPLRKLPAVEYADLMQVFGIGEKKFAKLKPFVKVK